MKNKIFWAAFILGLITISACDDMLEQLPKDEVSPETSFQTENDLKLYTNSLLFLFPSTSLYTETADNIVTQTLPEEIQGIRDASTSSGWSWGNLRKVNFFLDNSYRCPDEDLRNKYNAIARFFRAYFYFDMVKRYGDVPWYSHVLKEDDKEQLYKKRDSRQVIMDSMLVDIDYAIKYLRTDKKLNEVTKWTALALKSRFCLFEGTFRKYHGIDGSQKFLDQCIAASEELMNSGKYSIYKKNGPYVDYRDLFTYNEADPTEVITARGYSAELQSFHNLNYYTLTSSYGQPGLEKELVNSYLMKDGSRFTDIPGYETMEFNQETLNRDPRLSQTIRTPGYMRIGGSVTDVPQFGYSVTGYHVIKGVCSAAYDMYNKNENDLIIYRYAEILLNYAEAKAESGTLTQSDIDKSIKLIRERVDMPNLDLATANANPDPYLISQYEGVKGPNQGVILEIRRERRIELVMENFRYYDMIRWKNGKGFLRQFKGMYFSGPGFYDLDNDGHIDLCLYLKDQKPDDMQGAPQALQLGTNILLEFGDHGNVVVNPNIQKKWREDRDYLYPIPITQLKINPNLGQNLNWEE